jgi:hypothetical protein
MLSGSPHPLGVTTSPVYEALALALSPIEASDRAEKTPRGTNKVAASVKSIRIERAILVRNSLRWVEQLGRATADIVNHDRVREILGGRGRS